MQKNQGILMFSVVLALFSMVSAVPTPEPPFKLPGIDIAKGILDRVEEGVGSGIGQVKGVVSQAQSQVSSMVDTAVKHAAAVLPGATSQTQASPVSRDGPVQTNTGLGVTGSGDASLTTTDEAAPAPAVK